MILLRKSLGAVHACEAGTRVFLRHWGRYERGGIARLTLNYCMKLAYLTLVALWPDHVDKDIGAIMFAARTFNGF
jgi:hypothetical protein